MNDSDYRFLQIGETIRPSDETYSTLGEEKRWCRVDFYGVRPETVRPDGFGHYRRLVNSDEIGPIMSYERPLATDPKGQAGAAKPQLHLIPTEAMTEMAAALMNGAGRYGAWNWRGTRIKSSTYIAAMLRHTLAYRDGEDVAEDSLVTHLGHIMANCAILLDAAKHNALEDDRPTTLKQP